MGFAFRQAALTEGGVVAGNPMSVSFSNDVLAGSLIVALVGGYNNPTSTITSISDGVNTYILTPKTPLLTSSGDFSIGYAAGIGYWLSAPGGATTVTIKWDSTTVPAFIAVVEFSYTGGAAAFDVDAAASVTTNTATPATTPSITPTNWGELIVGFFFPNGTPSGVVGGGWNAVILGVTGWLGLMNYIPQAGTGSIFADWGDESNLDQWLGMMAAFTIPDIEILNFAEVVA